MGEAQEMPENIKKLIDLIKRCHSEAFTGRIILVWSSGGIRKIQREDEIKLK